MNQKNDEINLRSELRKVQVQLQHKEEAYKKLSDEKRVLESRTAFLQKSLEQVQEKLQEKET
ncbi:MAG: hypothetical protein ACFFCQ_06890, partial [Promethearchaeota archaeon]